MSGAQSKCGEQGRSGALHIALRQVSPAFPSCLRGLQGTRPTVVRSTGFLGRVKVRQTPQRRQIKLLQCWMLDVLPCRVCGEERPWWWACVMVAVAATRLSERQSKTCELLTASGVCCSIDQALSTQCLASLRAAGAKGCWAKRTAASLDRSWIVLGRPPCGGLSLQASTSKESPFNALS